MSNQDLGYWTGSFTYAPGWAPAPFNVTMGSTDANGVDWLWMSIQGWDSPGVVGQVVQRASDHGGWATEQYFTPRTFTVTVQASAPTQALRDTARASLQQVLPVNEMCTLVYGEPIPKMMQCRRSGQILETYPDLVDVQFQCVMVAPDPRKYSQTVKNFNTTMQSTHFGITSPWTMPVSLPAQPLAGSVTVTNVGSFETRPIITVIGPIASPVVYLDTGRYIAFTSLNLGTGDKLVIDTDARIGTLNGSYRNADIDSWWWVLQPGSHTITLGGNTSGSATLQVSFSDAWI